MQFPNDDKKTPNSEESQIQNDDPHLKAEKILDEMVKRVEKKMEKKYPPNKNGFSRWK